MPNGTTLPGADGFLDRFVSHVASRVDAIGRVSIPASFRSALALNGFEGSYVCPPLCAEALHCGGHALLRETNALLSPLSPFSEHWDAYASTLHGENEAIEIDGEGWVVLTETLKAHTRMTAEVTPVGQGHKFQIWEPGRSRAHLDEARRRVRDHRKRLRSGHAPLSIAPRPSGARD